MTIAEREILIGFGESLAAVECVWSLQRAGFRVTVFARRGKQSAARRMRGVRTTEITAPSDDVGTSTEELSKLLRSRSWACVMPLDDEAVWLLDQNRCRSSDVAVAGPVGALRDLGLDKRLQLRAARDAGFLVPPTAIVTAPEPVIAEDLGGGPFVVKPALAVSRVGDRLEKGRFSRCATRGDLLRSVAGASSVQPLLVQPSVHGTGEGVFGVSDDGPTTLSGHRRLRMMNPAGSGASACMSRALEPHEVAVTQNFLDNTGWQGLFMLEFLRDEHGTSWFMELNGRPWGSMALARRRGLEYPAWAVQRLLDEPLLAAAVRPREQVTCRHLGRELVHLAHVLRGPKGYQPTWPSRWGGVKAVLQVRPGDRWYNSRRDQPLVLLADTWFTVRQQLGRAR